MSPKDVLKIISDSIDHAQKMTEKLGGHWSPREKVIAQFAAAHTAKMLMVIQSTPPSVEDVKRYSSWWYIPTTTKMTPYILHLYIDNEDEIWESPGCCNQKSLCRYRIKFVTEGYTGKWAPCIPPEIQK